MALKKRVEVLFEEGKYAHLEQLARREKTSVGSLIREAVERVYLGADLEQRRQAVRWLLSQQSDLTWEEAKRILETDVGRRFDAS